MTKTKDRILNIPYKQTTEHCPRAVMSEIENILVIWETSVSHKLFTLRQSPPLSHHFQHLLVLSLPPAYQSVGRNFFLPPPYHGSATVYAHVLLMLSNSWPKDHYYKTLLKVVVIIKKVTGFQTFFLVNLIFHEQYYQLSFLTLGSILLYTKKLKVYFKEYVKGECIATLLSPTEHFVT